MSTLPILYSTRSLDKRPAKQGGIFALNVKNRANVSKSMNITSYQKVQQLSPEVNELISKNVSRYYISKTARDRNNDVQGTLNNGNNRYAKSNFNVTFSETVMVGPDTLATRLTGEAYQVDSVGALFKSIQTSVILSKTVLKNDSHELKELNHKLIQINEHISTSLLNIENQYKQKIDQMSKMLSQCRRQTGMETKVNNAQMEKLLEDSKNTAMVMGSLQQKTKHLGKQCNI